MTWVGDAGAKKKKKKDDECGVGAFMKISANGQMPAIGIRWAHSSSWTYEGGSSLKKESLLDAASLKCPPRYCQHGSCIGGDEHGKTREWWSQYFQNNWTQRAIRPERRHDLL
jgi:hypothetical protein